MPAERTVAVNLTAKVGQYLTGMKAAEAETRKFANTGKDARDVLHKQNEAMSKVGVGMAAFGGVAAAGLGLVLKASTEFGSKMAQLQSLSHATSGQMKQLGDAAMSAGAAYGFTASQVADAEIELTKAGVGVKQQLGGALKGALTLAAAGQIDVAQATEIATVAMTQFGLKAGDVPHLADLLAAGADKALGSVGDLGEALKNGGLQAKNMGLTMDDTIGVLSAFANKGILGAEAGTQLRSMFLRLQNPVAAAKSTLDGYGISINDASGKFVGITKFAGELHDKLGGLTQAQRNAALATIFGSHAIIGATALYQYGAKGIGDWIKAVNDTGFASAQASGKMNSLQGDVQKLSAAFQTDMIKAGSSADGVFRPVVQDITGVVTAFGNLAGPVQGGVVVVTALTAGIGLLGGGFLLLVPKIAATKLALAELGTSVGGMAGKFAAGGIALAGLTDIITSFAAVAEHGTASAQQVEQAGVRIQQSWKGVDKLFGSSGISLDSGSGLKKALDELGSGDNFSSSGAVKQLDSLTGHLTHLSDVFKANEGTFDAMGQQLAGLAKQNYGAATQSFDQLISKFHLTADETKNLLRVMPAYREELTALAGKAGVEATDQNLLALAQGKGAVSVKVLAAAQAEAKAAAEKQAAGLAELSGQAKGATQNLDQLATAIQGFGSAQLDARGAARKLEAAFDDAMSTIKKNGHTLSDFTAKGRENGDALDGIATAALGAASKYLTLHHNADGAAKVLAHGRGEFLKAAEAAGLSGKAAGHLADQLGLIPKNISTAVGVTGAKGVGNTVTGLSKNAKAFAKSYEAILRANGHPAAEAHKTAMAAAAKWAKQHPTATLDANNKKAKAAAKAAEASAVVFAQREYLARLLANGVPANEAIKRAKGAANAFAALRPNVPLNADPSGAIAAAARAQAAIDGVHSAGTVHIYVDESINKRLGRATGGAIDGPGPKGRDSVPAMLAPGEHVLTDKDVDRLGGQGGVYRFRQALQAGKVGAFAAGGAIGTTGDAYQTIRLLQQQMSRYLSVLTHAKAAEAADIRAVAHLEEQYHAASGARKTVLRRRIAAARTKVTAAKKRTAAAQHAASGTGLGALGETQAAINRYAREVSSYTKALATAKKMQAVDEAEVKRRQKIYDDIDGTEKNRAKKKAAKTALTKAKTAASAAAKRITADQAKLDKAKAAEATAVARRTALAQAREDFVSTQRRATADNPIDPLSYVDQLRSMSRETDLFGPKRRASFDAAANQYEAAIVKLSAASEKATAKLTDLQNASAQMRDSIKSAISGAFSLSGYAQTAASSTSRQVESGWQMQDGIRFNTYSTATDSTAPTAAGIDAYYSAGAASAKQFAAALQQLAGKGLNGNLLAELAGMGTEQGLPIAQALLSASTSQLTAINGNYTAIGGFADAAGKTVSDANFAAQIAAADRNAAQITAQLQSDGEKLRKLIATAFGLKGYAVGTTNATPGLHWVGEHGPELLQFAGGERVYPIRAGRTAIGAGGGSQRIEVAMPESLRLVDADGTFKGMVRVEAHGVATRVLQQSNDDRAILMVGGAAL